MDNKTCSICELLHGIEHFQLKRKPRKDGTIYVYRDSRCNACRYLADQSRYLRKMGRPKSAKVDGPLWPRPVDERDCDAAFMGWRNVAQCVPVGAMLGARL